MPPLIMEAIVAGTVRVARIRLLADEVVGDLNGFGDELSECVLRLAYIALAPVVGAIAAVGAIRGEQAA